MKELDDTILYTIRLKPSDHEYLRYLADKEGKPMSVIFTSWLRKMRIKDKDYTMNMDRDAAEKEYLMYIFDTILERSNSGHSSKSRKKFIYWLWDNQDKLTMITYSQRQFAELSGSNVRTVNECLKILCAEGIMEVEDKRYYFSEQFLDKVRNMVDACLEDMDNINGKA